MKRFKNLRAMSLVSLMIGMGLSVFLVAVLIRLFSATQRDLQLQQNMSVLNMNLKFATQSLVNVVSKAGYNPTTSFAGNAGSTAVTQLGVTGGYLTVNPDDVINGYNFPNFTVSLTGDGIINDCSGKPTVYNTAYNMQYKFQGGSTPVSLVCILNGGSTYTLLNGVVDQAIIRYAYDSTGGGNVDSYVSGTNVGDPKRVYGIKLALLVRTVADVKAKVEQDAFTAFDTQLLAPNDKKFRRLEIINIPFVYR